MYTNIIIAVSFLIVAFSVVIAWLCDQFLKATQQHARDLAEIHDNVCHDYSSDDSCTSSSDTGEGGD